jgi:hypothetical protein
MLMAVEEAPKKVDLTSDQKFHAETSGQEIWGPANLKENIAEERQAMFL